MSETRRPTAAENAAAFLAKVEGAYPTEDDIRSWAAAVRAEIRAGEFSLELMEAAKAAVERLKAHEGEDIHRWAKELAECWCCLHD